MKTAVKTILKILPVVALAFLLSSCAIKEAVQEKTREILKKTAESGGSVDAGIIGAASSPAEGFDAEYTIYIGGRDDWTPFPGKSVTSFTNSDDDVLSARINGGKVEFTGKREGDSVVAASSGNAESRALVHVRAMEGASIWTLRINEMTTLDMMGLAIVDYSLDLTATHVGPDMFGVYTGELGMEYSADLGGLQGFMAASGVDMDYGADGWFKNTDFRMELAPYSAEDENRFIDSLKDPGVTDEERDIINAYMGDMFAGIGGGNKDFETSQDPVGLWFDWAFHMTEGDMSAYVNMNSAMFSASASQDATAQHAEGYASAMLAGSFHESLDHENESPFPYQIEVYEGGEATLTLRSSVESPIVVKFYGVITKN